MPGPASPTTPAAPTRAIIDRVHDWTVGTLPPDVVTAVKHCLLDWIGVTIAGAREPVVRILLSQAEADGGRPECSLLGRSGKVNAGQACLVNGAAGHSLDYDDVLESMLGHPSVVVAPVVFALGERDRRSGADVLVAFAAGVQAAASVGLLVEPQHHERGWHTTATLGTFGATAAACHLLGLDRDAWNRAFGLAATQAGGLKSMFGTMGKPFHAGKAAAQGFLAASLAERGMTGALDVLEAPRGFLEVTTPGAATSPPLLEFAVRDVLFKAHAACYLTHSVIEGVLQLTRAHGLSGADVERIEVDVLPVHRTTCAISAPRTGLEAKFSLAYAAAIALAEGRAGEAQFTDEVVHRSWIRELADRVVLRDGDPSRARQMATPVRLVTRDGRHLDAVADTGTPARGSGVDRQWDRLVDKFTDLTTPVLGAAAAGAIVAAVEKFEELPVLDDLIGSTRGQEN